MGGLQGMPGLRKDAANLASQCTVIRVRSWTIRTEQVFDEAKEDTPITTRIEVRR
jgi:hypothetical protein